MKKINSARELHEAIEELEQKRIVQAAGIEHQFSEIYESLKPANIIRNTLQSTFSSADTKRNLLGSLIGLGTGLLSKKLLVGKSVGFFRKALGAAVEFGVAGVIAKNAGKIKDKGSELINKIFRKKSEDLHDYRSMN